MMDTKKENDVFSKRFMYYFAIGWSLFTMMYAAAITFIDIPEENIRFADSLMSFMMGTIISTVLNFFFGSSESSKNKTNLLIKK